MNRRIGAILLVACLAFAVVMGGCADIDLRSVDRQPGLVVTDVLGREVEVGLSAQKVVAIGPGAMRLCCYFNKPAIFAGVEQIEIDNPTGRPYLYANPGLVELPVIGPGGPNNAPDPERILALKPDVIFTTYGNDQQVANQLQAKTGIPVVVLSYGEAAAFDPELNASLVLIGQVIGMEGRAWQLVDLLQGFQNELAERSQDIAPEQKPSTYVGGLSMRGTHGIESTEGNYALFNAIKARNVVDESGKSGSLMIDKEQLLQWDPEIVFIDGAGFPLLRADYQKNRPFYQSLTAVQKGSLYQVLPYKSYTTNIDTAIANAYYMGKTLYPEQFEDIDPVQKADEIYELLLGEKVYRYMQQDFGGFKQLSFE